MKKIIPFLLLLFALTSFELNAQTCDAATIDVTVDVLDTEIDNQHAETTLTATNTIENGGEATYKAGTDVTLSPGFHAKTGSEFDGVIEACTLALESFITEWDFTSGTITIPTIGPDYNYDIDWGNNGTWDVIGATGTETYSVTGIPPSTIKVAIRGDFPRIYFPSLSVPEKNKITKIVQWGNIAWKSMERAFNGCENLEIDSVIPDEPDLHLVSNMDFIFAKALKIDYDFGSWDISNVTTMAQALTGTKLSRTNYENSLNGWSNLPNLQSNVTLGAAILKYCDETGRNILINTYGWNIQGDIKECPPIPSALSEEIINFEQEFNIYPNPAKDRIQIGGIDVKQNNVSIQILDVSGRVVLKKQYQTEFDISRLKSGVYFIHVSGENPEIVKFIKL